MKKCNYMKEIIKHEIKEQGYCEIERGVFIKNRNNKYIVTNEQDHVLIAFNSIKLAVKVLYGVN